MAIDAGRRAQYALGWGGGLEYPPVDVRRKGSGLLMLKGAEAASTGDSLPDRAPPLRRLRGALAWRGPDGRGLSLQDWMGVVATFWVALRLWPQTAGFAASGAFFVALAVLIPLLQVLARETHARPLRPIVRVL